MYLDELLLLLLVAGGSTGIALFLTWRYWRPPRHLVPAASLGMAATVVGQFALQVAFEQYPRFEIAVAEQFPEFTWLVVPFACATLGVGCWRAIERWYELDMTVAGVLGFDEPEPDTRPPRIGGGQFGVRTQLPPSRHGAKRGSRV